MFEFLRTNKANQIYLYEFLQKFGMGLIGIFIPIYIASNGSPIEWIFFYLLGYTVFFLLSAVPVSYIIAKIGFKHSLSISYLFYLPAFMLLRVFSLSRNLVIGVGLLIGLAKAFHWISLHSEFATDTESKGRGSDSGKMLGAPRLARAIAPFLGGVIMAVFGFPILVTATIFVFALSVLPLLASKDHRDPLNYGFRDFLDRKHLKFGAMFFLRGMAITSGVFLFPLFVYYIGGSIDAGGASSLASFGSVLFALFIGKASDRVEERHLIIIGLTASSLLFFLRSYVSTSAEAFIVSILAGLMFMVYYVPLYSELAELAEDEDILEFYAFREVALGLGKLSVLLVALFTALNTSLIRGLKTAFIITGLGIFLILFFVDDIEEIKS